MSHEAAIESISRNGHGGVVDDLHWLYLVEECDPCALIEAAGEPGESRDVLWIEATGHGDVLWCARPYAGHREDE